MLAALAPLLLLAATAEPSAEEILRRADAILAPDCFESELVMTTHRQDGEVRTFSMHVWKSGSSHHRIRFLSPADDRGAEVLRVGGQMWNFLPNLKRAVRISPKQDFHGGDFSNADVLRVNLSEDYVPTLERAEKEGFVLRLKAKDDSLAYDSIRYWIRRGDFMPLRQEFFTRSGKLVRKLDYLEPKRFGRGVRPSRLVMWNALVPSRRSELVVRAFDVKRQIAPELFELAALGR